MKKILIFSTILALIFTLTVSATPGDSNDPIVVLSYLNQRLDELKASILEQVATNPGETVPEVPSETTPETPNPNDPSNSGNATIDEELLKINTKIEEQNKIIETQNKSINDLNEKIKSLSIGANPLIVVDLKPGDKLIAGAGTEIILRAGRATAITTELGGLSDVTSGIDVKQDEEIVKNHHLIIPRDDGRGIIAITDAVFMVRGYHDVILNENSTTTDSNAQDNQSNPEDSSEPNNI